MDRENYKMVKGITVREWCEKNNNNNILKNWDYEKNGKLTPDNVARHASIEINFVCHICGYRFKQRLSYLRGCYGCKHCRGNKYVDLGKNGDYTVYCHITPDGKRYIGFTGLALHKRFGGGQLYGTQKFTDAIKKYGWENIEHIVLESGLTKEEASEKEIYYINYYNTLDDNYGYNIASGGIHGRCPISFTEEVRAKISKSLTGRKVSAEARKNMSLSHIGLDNHKSKTICKIDRNGNILNEYKSAKEAALINGFDYKSICRCACGLRKTYKRYVWKYKVDMEENNGT